jgi:hypothetical protein
MQIFHEFMLLDLSHLFGLLSDRIRYINVTRGSLFRLISKAFTRKMLFLKCRLRMALDVVCITIPTFYIQQSLEMSELIIKISTFFPSTVTSRLQWYIC